MSKIAIKSNCSGNFVIDHVGIRSTEPLALKSATWHGDTLNFEEDTSITRSKYTVTAISTIIGALIGVLLGGRFGGLAGAIGGVITGEYTNSKTDRLYDRKKYSLQWSESGRSNVSLNKLDLIGTHEYDINLPLAEVCEINSLGDVSINIRSDNPKTTLIANVSGVGSIIGKGADRRLKGFIANLNGGGKINGFLVSHIVSVNVIGIGNIFFAQKKNWLDFL